MMRRPHLESNFTKEEKEELKKAFYLVFNYLDADNFIRRVLGVKPKYQRASRDVMKLFKELCVEEEAKCILMNKTKKY